jgi:hypothetical protein
MMGAVVQVDGGVIKHYYRFTCKNYLMLKAMYILLILRKNLF